MAVPFLSRLGFIGLGKETTPGTAVPATFYVPVKDMKPEDVPEFVEDDAIIASSGKIRGVYQGVKDGLFEISGALYPESVGSWLVACGLYDSTTGTAGTKTGTMSVLAVGATSGTYTLTGGTAPLVNDVIQIDTTANGIAECRVLTAVSGAGPYTITWAATQGLQYAHAAGATANNVTGGSYTHAFRFSNNPGAVQPPSWTLSWYGAGVQGATQCRQYPGAMIDTFSITAPNKGMLTHSIKFMTYPSALAAKPTPTFATTPPFLGWEQALSIAGSADTKYLGGSIEIKRGTEAIHTAQNNQNPYNVFAAEMEANLKWKFLALDETEWNHMVANDQPSSVVTVTSPAGPVLTITNTVGAWKKAPWQLAQKYIQLGDVEVQGIVNATDGNGPIQASLVNTNPVGF